MSNLLGPTVDNLEDSEDDSFANSKASAYSKYKKMGTQVEKTTPLKSLQLPIPASSKDPLGVRP